MLSCILTHYWDAGRAMAYFLDRYELLALIANASWFAGCYVRWKKIGPERYSVKTNYQWER
jgi:hypothetical protein